MDHRLAVHTLARRYCQEQRAVWSRRYSDLAGHRPDSPEAYNTFPRYLVLEAILRAVEAIRPEAPRNVESLLGLLSDAARNAYTPMTLNLSSRIAQSAMDEERRRFIQYIRRLSYADIEAAELLPHRRTLSTEENERLWDTLRSAWNVDGTSYWYPLKSDTTAGDVLAFHTDYFDDDKDDFLVRALAGRGVTQVFELREGKQDGLELGLDLFRPFYNGLEGYWTSEEADWLVYASHESSVTLAGDWLVEAFRGKFRNCDECLYGGPFSTLDLRGTWNPAEQPQ